MQFHPLLTVHFHFLPPLHRLQNSSITLANIQRFTTISHPIQMVHSSPIITNKRTTPLSHTIYKPTTTPTCYNTKQPHLSPSKIAFTYINLPVHTEMCTSLTCYCRQHQSSRELPLYNARSFITSPNVEPRPTVDNNLHQLPHALSLGRISHGVTQSKMLTNFHTLRYENKARLVLYTPHQNYPNPYDTN
jgi:hypothetical protein